MRSFSTRPSSSPGNDTTPTFRARGITPGDTVSLHKVSDCTDTALVTVTSSSTATDLTLGTALTEGRHTFYFKHETGGTSYCSSVTATYVLDITDPTAPTIALGTGLSATDNDTTPTLTASRVVSGDTISLHKTSGCTDAALVAVDADDTSEDLTPSTALSEGSYTFYAKAQDSAGNSACSATGIAYSLDTTAPTAPTIALGTGLSAADTDTTPTLTASGVVSGDAITLHKISGCTDTALVTVTADATTEDLTPTTALTDGNYTFYAGAEDSAGNRACSATGVAYTLDATPPAIPTLALGTGITATDNDTTPTLSASNLVSGDTISLHKASGCTDTALVSVTADATTEDLTPTTALTEGSYTFYAKAEDAVGNSSCSTTALAYTLDTTAPSAPTIALGSGLSPEDNDTTPTLTASGVVSGDTISLHKASGCTDTALVTVTADATTEDLTPTTALADGNYTFYAKAEDTAGNSACLRLGSVL